MKFPLEFRFKVLTFAPKISVVDATGQEVAFIRQKLFKLKEHIEVYSDATQKNLLCDIRADRIIDFSASYHMNTADGSYLGAVRRRGFRSIWRASYELLNQHDQKDYEIHENNPLVKVFDSLLSEVPVIGFFTSLLLHPKYNVTQGGGEVVIQLSKRPAFFERKFRVDLHKEIPEQDQLRIILSLLMFALLERSRG